MDLISVIIPVYNVEQYIAATIQSVLKQTYEHFELLLINDGSGDRSLEICQQFKDSRIKIITQPNRGAAGARNTGIRLAQGKYIAFLDSDDLWHPSKIAQHIEHLSNSPQVGISYSSSAFIDQAGNLLGIYQIPKLKNVTAWEILCRNPIGNGSAAVIRREVFEEIKFQDNLDGSWEDFYFDESLSPSEDVELWFRMANQTEWQVEGISEALTLYRIYAGGTSANLLKKQESWEKMIDKARTYASNLKARWEKPVQAYHLRYLARRAVTLGDGTVAVQLAHRAIATYWRMWFEEPRRTGLTLAAAYSLTILPKSLYQRLEAIAIKAAGIRQKRRLQQQL